MRPILSTLAVILFAVPPAMAGQYHVPYFLSSSHADQQSFLRVTWLSCSSSWDLSVSILGIDDAGDFHGPIEFTWEWCDRILALNSDDLEYGNPAKGIPVGIGQGQGDWQLFLEFRTTETDVTRDLSDLDVQTFARTSDGFLTSMHDTVPYLGRFHGYFVGTFNPGRNTNQRSALRLINPHEFPVNVSIKGMHDGSSSTPEYGQRIPLPARGALTVTAQELEQHHPEWEADSDQPGYSDYGGILGGDPGNCYQCGPQVGKWRLRVHAQRGWGDDDFQSIIVINLMDTPTGHLTNLSSIRPMTLIADWPSTTAHDAEPEPEPEPPPATNTSFDIDVFFANGVGEVPRVLELAYEAAAERWEQVIVDGFPDEDVSLSRGQCKMDRDSDLTVDDLFVIVRMSNLGGASGPAARATPCLYTDAGSVVRRPYVGYVEVNADHWNDKPAEQLVGQPHDLTKKIAVHEIGHLLGFSGDIIQAAGHLGQTPNPHFKGLRAFNEFLSSPYDGRYEGNPVPMEFGHAHWHEEAFMAGAAYPEIMAPVIAKQSLLSEITLGALSDLGYNVDFSKADTLPWGRGEPTLKLGETVDLSGDSPPPN
ncbi:MAG: hypothetical protein OXC14_05215 [Rhodospirillaceae bacterium]|nr:hypothetical protein [Rhodospirillaceae bacterium]